MANRHQRFATYIPIRNEAEAGCDSIEYTPGGSKITLGIFPRFGSGFPDIPKVEIPLRAGAKAPPELPFTRGGMSLREIGGEPYCIYCIGVSGGILEVEKGMPTTNYQAIGIVTKRSGEVVRVLVGDGADVMENHSHFARYAIHKMDFDRVAKPIESKNLITRINQVDEMTLTHTYAATIRVPGGGEYRVEGMVKELRDKGGVPNGSFSYWKRAWSWAVGDRVAAVAEDFTGNYHVGVFTNGGQNLGGSSNNNSLQIAISQAASQLQL